ncbi:MAG TPA: ERCC4 domain-containing protein [Nitrososphaeraceae archaeon]|nr:ERCC4 domain-containing protein [Nitrososphaeraceae archaeon]
MPVRIVVDERERKSGIPDLLRQAGATIDFAQLNVGDYIVSPETAVERKTIQDLLNSIFDGRLFVQCSQLNEHYVKPVLIVEGNIVDLMDIREEEGEEQECKQKVNGELENIQEKNDKERVEEMDINKTCKSKKIEVSPEVEIKQQLLEESILFDDVAGKNNVIDYTKFNQRSKTKSLIEKIPLIYDALAKVALDFRIPVIHTPSADYTSQLLVVMVNKSLHNGRATGPLLKRIKKVNPEYIQQLSIISSLPGVGDKLAARMLDKFQTPIRALNASSAELARISGFGTERASKVRRILDNMSRQTSNSTSRTAENGVKIKERGFEVIQRTLLDNLPDIKSNEYQRDN